MSYSADCKVGSSRPNARTDKSALLYVVDEDCEVGDSGPSARASLSAALYAGVVHRNRWR